MLIPEGSGVHAGVGDGVMGAETITVTSTGGVGTAFNGDWQALRSRVNKSMTNKKNLHL